MTVKLRHAVATALLGFGLIGASTGQAQAIPCGTGAVSLATLLTPGYSCTQQDKIWSDFSSTNLPGTSSAIFALVVLPGLDEHTLSILGDFAQETVYDFSYTIAIDTSIAPDITFSAVTGGILFASPGGTATLTKTFTDEDFLPLPGLFATAANPVVSALVPGLTKTLHVTDSFFTDGSNVTGFANTFTQTVLPTPEPASAALLGAGMIGLSLAWRRRR